MGNVWMFPHCDDKGCNSIRYESDCPFCGDTTIVNLARDEVPIVMKWGRLCSSCYELQEIVR